MKSDRPPGVLLIGNFLSGAGGSRGVCEELAERLAGGGWSVLTTSSKRARLTRFADMMTTVWRRRAAYEVAQVDVFSGPAFTWAEAACGALRAARRPYVVTLHGGNLPLFADRWPARVRRVLRSAAAVTTPSRFLLESFRPHRDDVRCIPNGIDVEVHRPRPTVALRPRLVWLRAFHRLYDPSLAVRTMPHVLARYPSARLTMIGADKGDGSRADAERLAAELGIREHIDFLPAVDKRDVPLALGRGDIFLNTSTVDNAPVTVIEAMASALCVVSTNVGGVPYLIDDQHDGLLVAPGNPEAMAGAVLRLLDDSDFAARLARSGRRRAEQYDWSAVMPEWRALLAATARSTTSQSTASCASMTGPLG